MDEYLAALDEELRQIVAPRDPAYDAYYGMFRYHLGWTDRNFAEVKSNTGKRLRPLLCLLTCEAVGGDWRRALPIAAAIELVHNFSLIHDDIEDQSAERRGRATVWKVWGLAQGLNAGDGMFVLARLALGRMRQHKLSAKQWAEVSAEFDAATLALCQGQFLDLSFETRLDVSEDEYLQMIQGKTAALISAATRLGAMPVTDDRALIVTFAHFGENVGMAFQITDDILGIWGDPSVTGKSAASDILSKKKSLPVIIGLNDLQHGETLRAIYRQARLARDDATRVLELLDAVGARAQAQRAADEYRAVALATLDLTKTKNRAMDRLREIVDVMTNRVR